MRPFYFHLATRTGWEADEIGTPCATVEHAMIEAWRTACEMSVDLLRQGQSPSGHRFEVHDEAGDLVFELHFSDLLAGVNRPTGGDKPAWQLLRRRVEKTQQLQSEMSATLVRVRATVSETYDLLARVG